MQTTAMAILQKAPHVIPSSLQINRIRSTVRLDSEKKLACYPGLKERSMLMGEVHARCLKDVCPAAQDEEMFVEIGHKFWTNEVFVSHHSPGYRAQWT